MKNKNLLLFIVLSMGLLGIYYAFTPKPQAPPPVANQAIETPSQPSAPMTPSAAPAATALDPGSLFMFENSDLKLVWRKRDGSLVQAEWKKDGTRFFPEEKRDEKTGRITTPAFLGIGGIANGAFEGDPESLSIEGFNLVRFHNAAGEQLSYRIPARGHVVSVDWQSSQGTRLMLVRGLKDMPKAPDGNEFNPLHGLGRVFAISDKHIDAVAWMDTLKDPWYSFLGGKRKVLPAAAQQVGLDAGIEASAAQRTHFFAAIWDSPSPIQLDFDQQPGYHLTPDASGKATARLYLGPKHKPELEAFAKSCTQVMDFGFFGLVAKVMFWILLSIQRFVPNWGWAIVVFSVALRLALWPLNNKTTIQLMRMKDLEPHQKALQAKYEKFGNDMQKKAEMQKELMAFYKKNGHNPMGGCLPMLLQMPVFFALWSMLSAVFELRHATWILWVHDLSAKDPFFVLPVLLGVSMIAQQLMTPATGDPAQRKMMMFLMPAMMTFFFSSTPAGLCLYYLIFNLIGMGQTWWVMRNYKAQPVVI